MTPRFYGRTPPGLPADWHERAIIGASRRASLNARVAFVLGLLVGLLLVAAAR